jgi:hypothetical protein
MYGVSFYERILGCILFSKKSLPLCKNNIFAQIYSFKKQKNPKVFCKKNPKSFFKKLTIFYEKVIIAYYCLKWSKQPLWFLKVPLVVIVVIES